MSPISNSTSLSVLSSIILAYLSMAMVTAMKITIPSHPAHPPLWASSYRCHTPTKSFASLSVPKRTICYDGANIDLVLDDSLEKFEIDVTHLTKKLKSGVEDDDIFPAVFSQSKFSITRIWNLNMWREHTSRWRYVRHMLTLYRSRLLKRIFPQLSASILWSVLVTYILTNPKISFPFCRRIHLPLGALSLVSTFLAFMLTIRTNQGLDRLSEGRNLWGRASIVVRDTAQLFATHAYPKHPELALQAARYLVIFPWVLRSRLRDSDESDLIHTILSRKSDIHFVQQARKPAAAVIAALRSNIALLASKQDLPLVVHHALEKNLSEMNFILGMCARIRGSPIPPVYTSHLSRLLVFYLMFLPLALFSQTVSPSDMVPIIAIVVSMTVGFAMLGLDEISHLLEQPFQVMPLHALSKEMTLDIADTFILQPPSFTEGKKSCDAGNNKNNDIGSVKSNTATLVEKINQSFGEDQQPPTYW